MSTAANFTLSVQEGNELDGASEGNVDASVADVAGDVDVVAHGQDKFQQEEGGHSEAEVTSSSNASGCGWSCASRTYCSCCTDSNCFWCGSSKSCHAVGSSYYASSCTNSNCVSTASHSSCYRASCTWSDDNYLRTTTTTTPYDPPVKIRVCVTPFVEFEGGSDSRNSYKEKVKTFEGTDWSNHHQTSRRSKFTADASVQYGGAKASMGYELEQASSSAMSASGVSKREIEKNTHCT